jgi:hypothetical protein
LGAEGALGVSANGFDTETPRFLRVKREQASRSVRLFLFFSPDSSL